MGNQKVETTQKIRQNGGIRSEGNKQDLFLCFNLVKNINNKDRNAYTML